jgi:hypothetical protein
MRVAGDVVALTFSIVRGFAIRRMIVDDRAEFERLIGVLAANGSTACVEVSRATSTARVRLGQAALPIATSGHRFKPASISRSDRIRPCYDG